MIVFICWQILELFLGFRLWRFDIKPFTFDFKFKIWQKPMQDYLGIWSSDGIMSANITYYLLFINVFSWELFWWSCTQPTSRELRLWVMTYPHLQFFFLLSSFSSILLHKPQSAKSQITNTFFFISFSLGFRSDL